MFWQAAIFMNGGFTIMEFVALAGAIALGVIVAKGLQSAFGL